MQNSFEKNVFVIHLKSNTGNPPSGLLISREICRFYKTDDLEIEKKIDCTLDKGDSDDKLQFMMTRNTYKNTEDPLVLT